MYFALNEHKLKDWVRNYPSVIKIIMNIANIFHQMWIKLNKQIYKENLTGNKQKNHKRVLNIYPTEKAYLPKFKSHIRVFYGISSSR